MSQDIILILLLVAVAYAVYGIRKSHKYEIKSTQPDPKVLNRHIKTTPIKPRQAVMDWKKEDSLLPKNSSSRSKRELNRSCLRQSILTSEILNRKY
ncbi:MAG: FeoB-associated Cys-rich membrane protein [Chlamydiales bacterium]|jgi:hypothetical protein|nr:FeoB-associated Cys-rich membrane protein [Chlamydiales bacterium]